MQANLLRSPADADALVAAGVHVRLVKGAYVEASGAHPYGEPTDVAYLRLGLRLAETGATWSMATRDGRLREALLLAHGPVRSSSCSAYTPRSSPTCATAPFPRGSASPTAPTGSATGSAASPNPGAPDPDIPNRRTACDDQRHESATLTLRVIVTESGSPDGDHPGRWMVLPGAFEMVLERGAEVGAGEEIALAAFECVRDQFLRLQGVGDARVEFGDLVFGESSPGRAS